MRNAAQRIAKDLLADSKKTAIMLSLSVVLLIICWVRFGKGRDESALVPVSVDVESGSAVSDLFVYEKEIEKPPFPEFLNAALSFEQIGQNPFAAGFISSNQISFTETAPGGRRPEGIQTLQETKSSRMLQVTCTLTGEGERYAIVDGRILQEGDDHKKLTVKEIGDGYVVFSGPKGLFKVAVRF